MFEEGTTGSADADALWLTRGRPARRAPHSSEAALAIGVSCSWKAVRGGAPQSDLFRAVDGPGSPDWNAGRVGALRAVVGASMARPRLARSEARTDGGERSEPLDLK